MHFLWCLIWSREVCSSLELSRILGIIFTFLHQWKQVGILNIQTDYFKIVKFLTRHPCWGTWKPSIPFLMSKYNKWYIIGKLLCSTLRICKKICKFAKNKFFIPKSSYIVKMFAKKFVQKIKSYTFLKSPWSCNFKYAKIFAKF